MAETLVPTRFTLAELLERKGMTQTELARLSRVSQVTVNALATNRTKRVDLATLDAIATVLGVQPGELLEQEPEPRKRRKR